MECDDIDDRNDTTLDEEFYDEDEDTVDDTANQDPVSGPFFWQHDTVANTNPSASKATCNDYRVVITAQLSYIQRAWL